MRVLGEVRPLVVCSALLLSLAACEPATPPPDGASPPDVALASPALASTAPSVAAVPGGSLEAPFIPVPLALEVEDGNGIPLQLRSGQTYYVNQIDLRASLTTDHDEGLSGLTRTGDFAELPWRGLGLRDSDVSLLPNPDGTFNHRRFYRGAQWMEAPSEFIVEQLDANGRPLGWPLVLHTGKGDRLREPDTFFVRRLRGIQWTQDCVSPTDCTGAKSFMEEALVELRNSRHPERTFTLSSRTAALRVRWTLHRAPYVIPVQQVAQPTFSYGFSIGVEALTPPRADGSYAPGTDLQFRLTLKDGEGNRLHPEGSLPTYAAVAFGAETSGIKYYNAFFDPTLSYYRRKHRERMLIASLNGPVQDEKPITSFVEMDDLLGPQDVQFTGTEARDGVVGQFRTFPPANDLFGGAFDPAHAAWFKPVSDTWTFHLPADAKPGTYLVTVKGRRVYMGEDIPATTQVPIQVGTPQVTTAHLSTGRCSACHVRGGELGKILHANTNRASCAACHAPLGFEYDGPIFVRLHFIHSRSPGRYAANLARCTACHVTSAGIQRTSKAACLSCHTGYPADHVQAYGPVTSIFVGGGRESFQQCTSACHRTHPKSGF